MLFERIRTRRRERRALDTIVTAMQSEEQMVLDDLCRQVEDKLLAMTPEERAKAIAIVKQ